jgi:hypothetical protein
MIVIFGSSVAAANDVVCRESGRVSAPCYEINGTLMIYANSRPYLKLSNNKTLSISSESDAKNAHYLWPAIIDELLTLDNSISGDFTVCPMDKAVCIEHISQMKIE